MGELAVKIDKSKTYDRVNWQHVKDMMRHMGFREE